MRYATLQFRPIQGHHARRGLDAGEDAAMKYVYVYRCQQCGEKFESALMKLLRGQTAMGVLGSASQQFRAAIHQCNGLNYGLGELIGLRDEITK